MFKLIFLILLVSPQKPSGVISPEINPNYIKKTCNGENLTFYNHTPFSYLIKEPELCSGDVFLLTYVQSSSFHFKRRMMIRETWGSLRYASNGPLKLMFLIGYSDKMELQKKIEEESINYRDIIQGDFKDSYKNLTLKHIVALHWIINYCPQAQFVSKTDDDTFINIFNLVLYLKDNLKSTDKFILGKIAFNETPIREPGYKWTINEEIYSNDKYPPFLKGFAYIISKSAIEPLFICSYYVKFLFIDDVFITGLVSRLAGIKLQAFDKVFGHFWISKEPITVKNMDNFFFVSQTEYYPKQWRTLWKNMLKIEF